MAIPAGRVLALLERVQESPGLTAPQLARQLRVSERTVRRYVATLQELGIPVEADRGTHGGHRLRAAFARQARRMSATAGEPAHDTSRR